MQVNSKQIKNITESVDKKYLPYFFIIMANMNKDNSVDLKCLNDFITPRRAHDQIVKMRECGFLVRVRNKKTVHYINPFICYKDFDYAMEFRDYLVEKNLL